MVKQDVEPFIKNTEKLEIWSNDYFLQLANMIKFVNILELEMSSGRWIIQISLHAIRFLNSATHPGQQRRK